MNKQTDNKPTILLVEDDEKLASLICRYLKKNDFNVISELRGDTAIPRILNANPELVVLDIMLPGADGFEVCKQVRNQFQGAILMLTAKDEDIDQIVGLEIGADDYVVKPVEPRLLLARIRALLRRTANNTNQDTLTTQPSGKDTSKHKLEFGALSMDRDARIVKNHTTEVELSSTEFDLLWLLASHAGEILTREYLCQSVFNFEYNGLNRSVDNKISRLRKLLNDNSAKPQGIKTIRNQGYLFVASYW